MYKMEQNIFDSIKGGALLSEGGYGCVYYPGLNCKLQEEKGKTGSKHISKVQRFNTAAKNEIEVGKIVKTIPYYKRFFAPIVDTCNVTDLSPLLASKENECSIFKKKNPSKKYILMKIPYVGKQTFFKYFTETTEIKQLLLNIFSTFTYLILAIDMLHQKDIIHYDLKGENIMFDNVKKVPIIIDFGLSVDLNTIKTVDDMKRAFYIYAPDYYLWCPEIHFLSYLATVNPSPTKQEISDIADHIIEENIPLHYVCSPAFIKMYKTALQRELLQYYGKTPIEVFNKMRATCYSWDSYAISIMYLRILYYLNSDGFVKNDFIIYFTQLLLQNIHPTASRRFTPKETIAMFNNYSFKKYSTKYDDYASLYRVFKDNKEKIDSLLMSDEKDLNTIL